MGKEGMTMFSWRDLYREMVRHLNRQEPTTWLIDSLSLRTLATLALRARLDDGVMRTRFLLPSVGGVGNGN